MRWATLVLCLLSTIGQSAFARHLEVRIEGLQGAPLQNVRAFLGIEKEKGDADILESRIRRLHSKAPEQIRRALEPFGYYRAQVTSELTGAGGHWTARYQIDPGTPVKIATVEVQITGEGADDTGLLEIRQKLPVRSGDVLEHPRYENAKQALLRRARARGYLDARLTRREAAVDLASYSAAITLHLDTGSRYAFGPLTFVQEGSLLSEKLLTRYVPFQRGEPFNGRGLLELHNVLTDSEYFSHVEVRPQHDAAEDNEVPIEVVVTPRKRRRYRLGLGFGTDTGPRASLSYRHRLNRLGHVATANLKLSTNINSAALGYAIPLRRPAVEQLLLQAGLEDEDTNSRDSRITQLSARRSGTRGEWREVLALNYEREEYRVGSDQQDDTRLLYPSVTWARTRADDRLYPTHGTRLRLELLGASDGLLSDSTFLQTQLGAKWVRGLSERDRILLRGDLGATWVSDIDDLPASKRFYAGGDQSVRGYGFEALGPKNSRGEVIGGKYLAVGSLEYERRLIGNWSGALFLDMGNAVNNLDADWKHSAGFGVRWKSPIGPVRVDLAWALREPGDPLRLHVVIGPDL